MNRNGQGKVAVIGLLAVILIAGYLIIRQIMPQRYASGDIDWVCEECEYRFQAPSRLEPRDCPACPGEAVRSYMYYDVEREELIELYRARPGSEIAPAFEEIVKEPGGEWMERDYEFEREYGFPFIVDNPDALKYAPPDSEYR